MDEEGARTILPVDTDVGIVPDRDRVHDQRHDFRLAVAAAQNVDDVDDACEPLHGPNLVDVFDRRGNRCLDSGDEPLAGHVEPAVDVGGCLFV